MKKLILFLLLIIIISVVLNKTFNKEGFTSTKKGCLILYGESFREGKQFDRTRDTQSSFDNQMDACNSHIKFIKQMKEKYNIDIDVSISTYCSKYEKELKEKYDNYNLKYSCQTEMIDDVGLSIKNIATKGVDQINKNNYDFLLFTRNDICFKDEFINTFQPSETILCVSQHWTHHDCFKDNSVSYPVVNATILYVPKKYFFITKDLRIDHDLWKYYIQNHNLKNSDFGLMLNTYHDSDSYKDYNPLYYMVGREQTKNWYDKDKKNTNDWTNNTIKCYSYTPYTFVDTK